MKKTAFAILLSSALVIGSTALFAFEQPEVFVFEHDPPGLFDIETFAMTNAPPGLEFDQVLITSGDEVAYDRGFHSTREFTRETPAVATALFVSWESPPMAAFLTSTDLISADKTITGNHLAIVYAVSVNHPPGLEMRGQADAESIVFASTDLSALIGATDYSEENDVLGHPSGYL